MLSRNRTGVHFVNRCVFLDHIIGVHKYAVPDAWVPACLPACPPACRPAGLPACLPACLRACLPTCLLPRLGGLISFMVSIVKRVSTIVDRSSWCLARSPSHLPACLSALLGYLSATWPVGRLRGMRASRDARPETGSLRGQVCQTPGFVPRKSDACKHCSC